MSDERPATRARAKLLDAEPQLFVAELAGACTYYTRKLGFTVAFTYGEPPHYGQVYRDGARLNLRLLVEPPIDPELRAKEHLLSASITVDDAQSLFVEFAAAGVVFHQMLRTEPWGARTFVVSDPDGNLILFAAHASLASSTGVESASSPVHEQSRRATAKHRS